MCSAAFCSRALSWFADNKFYELTTLAEKTDKLILARLGASDPHFNLRRDGFFLLGKEARKNALFVSAIRPHGSYCPVSEIPVNPYPKKIHLKVEVDIPEYTIVRISLEEGPAWILMIANEDNSHEALHSVSGENDIWDWRGAVSIVKLENE